MEKNHWWIRHSTMSHQRTVVGKEKIFEAEWLENMANMEKKRPKERKTKSKSSRISLHDGWSEDISFSSVRFLGTDTQYWNCFSHWSISFLWVRDSDHFLRDNAGHISILIRLLDVSDEGIIIHEDRSIRVNVNTLVDISALGCGHFGNVMLAEIKDEPNTMKMAVKVSCNSFSLSCKPVSIFLDLFLFHLAIKSSSKSKWCQSIFNTHRSENNSFSWIRWKSSRDKIFHCICR